MLILPYSTELRFNWKSYVSYIIILLGLLIFILHDKNRCTISPVLYNYCVIISELLRLEPGNLSQKIFALAAKLNNTTSPSL